MENVAEKIERKNMKELLRKPRRSKQVPLPQICLKVSQEDKSDESSNENDTQSGKITPLTDREFISSSLYLQKPFSYSNRPTPKTQNNEFTGKHVNSLAYMSSTSQNDEFLNESNEFDHQQKIPSRDNLSKRLMTIQMTRKKQLLFDKSSQTSALNKYQREFSQFESSNPLLKAFKPLGPDPLPPRKPKHFENKAAYYQGLSYEPQMKESPFELNDFLLDSISGETNLIISDLKDKVLSRQNYIKFCKMLEEKIRQESKTSKEKLHVQTLALGIEPFENRVPLRQIIIEMANFLKTELSTTMGVNLKAKFNPLPKWQKMHGSHTEIVVYEDLNPRNNSMKESTAMSEDDQITPAQLAIVDSLLRNGLVLNLKAHFIEQLPDLSPLQSTLIYINLSFNNFTQFPHELLRIRTLEAIKLRNNPLRSLPPDMSQLRNLKILTLSYCQLTLEIPTCVYMLENLRHLDVSYNSIKFISKLITNLNNLKYFNVEGNEIEYLPAVMLTHMTHLEMINVKNNYLHPLLWEKSLSNKVQSLFDMSILVLSQNYVRYKSSKRKISSDIEYILQNYEVCDCCGGPRYGEGLKLIRPCLKIFGVKYLPFMFQCCSSKCLQLNTL